MNDKIKLLAKLKGEKVLCYNCKHYIFTRLSPYIFCKKHPRWRYVEELVEDTTICKEWS